MLGYVEEAYAESPEGNMQLVQHMELRDQIAALTAKTNDIAQVYENLKVECEDMAN